LGLLNTKKVSEPKNTRPSCPKINLPQKTLPPQTVKTAAAIQAAKSLERASEKDMERRMVTERPKTSDTETKRLEERDRENDSDGESDGEEMEERNVEDSEERITKTTKRRRTKNHSGYHWLHLQGLQLLLLEEEVLLEGGMSLPVMQA
jgi:type IV secretory pathway VirB10-like protein